jgi:hypothetical protein
MSKNFLSFLDNATIEEVTKSPRTGGGKSKAWNPAADFPGIRIWKDGSVFPSEALVKQFDLEYKTATVTKGEDDKKEITYANGQGNGLDVIDSKAWGQLGGVSERFIAVAVTPKELPKVDMFARTLFDDKGAPLASVLDQGSPTFGENTLLPLLKEVYNVEPNEEGFMDLRIILDQNLKALSPNGVFHLPKTISRGAEKGKADYVRRENIDIFVIVPETVYLASLPQNNGGGDVNGGAMKESDTNTAQKETATAEGDLDENK